MKLVIYALVAPGIPWMVFFRYLAPPERGCWELVPQRRLDQQTNQSPAFEAAKPGILWQNVTFQIQPSPDPQKKMGWNLCIFFDLPSKNSQKS